MAEPITDYKTQEALNESLAEWQERLFLQHWNIKAALVHGEEIEGCGGECTVQWANSCGTIRLRYANEMPEGMEKMPHEKILVHELLHFKYMGFQEANASIEGIYYDEKQHQLIEQMAKKQREQMALVAEMEAWIEGVPDPEMRTILRLYYRDGLSQREIAKELSYDQSIISRKIKVFWQMQK